MRFCPCSRVLGDVYERQVIGVFDMFVGFGWFLQRFACLCWRCVSVVVSAVVSVSVCLCVGMSVCLCVGVCVCVVVCVCVLSLSGL